MKVLKGIRVATVFKMSLVLGGVAGLLVGLILAVSSFMDKRWIEGLITFILAPILYGLMGALMNAFMAWLYNRVAERIGGIEIDLE